MGILSFLKSLINPRVMCEQIVATQVNMYHKIQKNNPNQEPHENLAMVWLTRVAARSGPSYVKNNNELLSIQALSETHVFACIQPPHCARALGLYILYKERPQWLERYSEFQEEFNCLMKPVFEAQANGTMEQLYKRYNPRMAYYNENLVNQGLSFTGKLKKGQAEQIKKLPYICKKCGKEMWSLVEVAEFWDEIYCKNCNP